MLVIHESDDLIRIEGEINRGNVLELVERLTATTLPVNAHLLLDFHQAELEDGLAMLATVNTLRALASRVTRLTLRNAPPVVCNHIKHGPVDHGIVIEELDECCN